MTQSVKDKVLSRIQGHGRGWCFSQKDLLDISRRNDIDRALSTLVREGPIRRVGHGLYSYPEYSELLQQEIVPDIRKAAEAIARKYGWRILPIGAIAANMLGLSEQVPAKVVYLSDGHTTKRKVGNITIQFKHTEPRDLNVKNRGSSLVIQALKYTGKARADDKVILALRRLLPEKDRARLLKDARYGTDWIYEVVKKICVPKDEKNG